MDCSAQAGMSLRGGSFFKSGYPVGVFSRKVKKFRPLKFLANIFGPLKFSLGIFRPLKENEWNIQENWGKLRKFFTPLKFLAKIFAPLKKHSNQVSGLKKDPTLNWTPTFPKIRLILLNRNSSSIPIHNIFRDLSFTEAYKSVAYKRKRV